MRLTERPDPEPPAGWARVQVRRAAVCMTDLEVLSGSIRASYPVIPGHEWSGVVESVGAASDAGWLGVRVAGDNEVTCMTCRYCRTGEWRRCVMYQQIGFELPGACAEYVLVPVPNLHQLPENVSFEQGALLEPLGVGLAVANMARARIAATAIVLGVGPIGLNCLAALKASGVRRILCLDRRIERLALALSWGAYGVAEDAGLLAKAAVAAHEGDTDIVVEATGHPDMLRLGAELVRFGGALVLAGHFGGREVALNPDLVHERNVRIFGAGNNSGFLGAAASAAGDGLLHTEPLITHRLGLEDFERAYSTELIEQKNFIKAIFDLEEGSTYGSGVLN